MTKEHIHVIIKFRPKNKREKREEKEQNLVDKHPIIFQNNDDQNHGVLEICGTKSSNPHNFTFDRILEAGISQHNCFKYVAEHVCNDVLEGFNGTIFAYGQTGSGKTYTMFGPEGQESNPQKMGIIPRAVSYIFSEIEEDDEILEARIKVSFVEIYKEQLRDLLNPNKKAKKLLIKTGTNGEMRIANVTETHVLTLLDVLQLIEIANSYRTKAETSMNHSSSRSHMLMTLTVALKVDDGSIRIGKLNFCDLAGSEKVRKTNATGSRLKEAQKINLSLTILGQVISALSMNKKHVPFRDSKLTHILKDSLGGNCKTTLIVNCSKSIFNRDETVNSLRFGSRCKLITNNVKVNRIYSNAELMTMIEKLRKQNTQMSLLLSKKGLVNTNDNDTLITSPKGNKLFNKKQIKYRNNNNQQKEEQDEQVENLKKQIASLQDKVHYLQVHANKIEEKRHEIAEKLSINEKQHSALNARLTEYQSRCQQQEKDINRMDSDNQQLRLEIKSLQSINEEYKMEIGDIKKDRHYKTSKLSVQLEKFKELHNDAIEETEELMDELLKLKQGSEKSEAIIDAQDNQLIQKRKDIDNLQRKLAETEKRVSKIFKEKMSLQTQLNEFKTKWSESQTEIKKLEQDLKQLSIDKDTEIEKLKDELDERTQKLTTENYTLTQKLETREMIQHSYSLRGGGIGGGGIANIISSPSPSSTTSKFVISNDYDNLNAPNTDLMHSSSLNSMQDVVKAEENILAQHEYLQKMETERLVERHSTGTYNGKNRRHSALNKKVNGVGGDNLNIEQIKKEVLVKEKKLTEMRNTEAPIDKEKRLQWLLDIAVLDDQIKKNKAKIKQIEKQNLKKNIKKTKKDKTTKATKDTDLISKVTTIDAMNYIDAALTLKQVQDNNDDDDQDQHYVV